MLSIVLYCFFIFEMCIRDSSYIFFGKHFNKMIPQYLIRTTLEKHLDLCHLKRMTPHDFRHTYVSMLIHEGYDDTSIAELIGDSVLTVRTAVSYTHLDVYKRQVIHNPNWQNFVLPQYVFLGD